MQKFYTNLNEEVRCHDRPNNIHSAAYLGLLEIKGLFWPSIDEIIKTTHELRIGCNWFKARTRFFPTIASKLYHHTNLLVTKPEPLIYRSQATIKRASRSAIHLNLCWGWNEQTHQQSKAVSFTDTSCDAGVLRNLSSVAGTVMWRWAELATDRLNLGSHRSTVSRSFTLHTTTKSIYTSRLIIFPLYNYFTPAESFRQN